MTHDELLQPLRKSPFHKEDPVVPFHDHPDFQGLMRAVIEAPTDPFPRMVMADWLDGFGEGYEAVAEAIRLDLGEGDLGRFEIPNRFSMPVRPNTITPITDRLFVRGVVFYSIADFLEGSLVKIFTSNPVVNVHFTYLPDLYQASGDPWGLRIVGSPDTSLPCYSPVGIRDFPEGFAEFLGEYKVWENGSPLVRHNKFKRFAEHVSKAAVNFGRNKAGLPPI